MREFIFKQSGLLTLILSVFSGVTILLIAMINISAHSIKQKYTIMPSVRLAPYGDALRLLREAGFSVDENCMYYDGAKVSELKYNVPLSNTYASYTEPEAGCFLQKKTSVYLYLTSSTLDLIEPMSISSGINNEQIKKELYYSIESEYIPSFNTDQFSLYINEKGLELLTDDEDYNRDLGSAIEKAIVVQLYEYYTNQLVEEVTLNENNDVSFTDLRGTYYYKVMCDGYRTVIPQNPFTLEYRPSSEKDNIPWGVNLESEEAVFSDGFQVCVVSAEGMPVSNAKVNVRVFRLGNEQRAYSSLPLHTDENGYLTLWHAINEVDKYDIVTFKLNNQFYMEIFDDRYVATILPPITQNTYTVILEENAPSRFH